MSRRYRSVSTVPSTRMSIDIFRIQRLVLTNRSCLYAIAIRVVSRTGAHDHGRACMSTRSRAITPGRGNPVRGGVQSSTGSGSKNPSFRAAAHFGGSGIGRCSAPISLGGEKRRRAKKRNSLEETFGRVPTRYRSSHAAVRKAPLALFRRVSSLVTALTYRVHMSR